MTALYPMQRRNQKGNSVLSSRQFLAITAAAATGLACLLTGCTGAAPAPAPSATPLRVLLTSPADAGDRSAIEANYADFEKKSGVKVDLQFMAFDQMRTVIQTQLRSGEAPDVFQYSPGPGFAGAFAKAGLLTDLTDAFATRGWKTYDSASAQLSFDGKKFGVPLQIDVIGMFYNKDVFTKLGLKPPTTIAELTAACAPLKKAGVIPIAVSDQEGWEGGHLLSMSLSSRVGGKDVGAYFTDQADWKSQDVIDSIQTWKDLSDAGCFNPSPTGTKYDAANALFTSGKAAMTPTGSWMISTYQKDSKFEVGLTPFPSPEAGKGVFSTGVGNGLLVSGTTKNLDAALKLLDWYQTPEQAKFAIEKRALIPPLAVDVNGLQVSPLMADVLASTANVAASGGSLGQNIDVLSTDAFNTAMTNGMQALLSGQKTAQQVAADLATAKASQ